MKSLTELRHDRIHRTDIGLILGELMPVAERAVIAAHHAGNPAYHRPILEALKLLRQAQRALRADY